MKLLAAVPDPVAATGIEKVKRLRNLLMLTFLSLHGLRTVEVHRAGVEDLTERGGQLALLVRGKMRDQIVYGKLGMAAMQEARTQAFKPPSAEDPVLEEFVQRLVEAYHPLQIYLFGSAARGDAGPDSDYDIMVVVPDDAPLELRDCKLGYQALRGLGIAKDILVWARHNFDEQLHLKASLPSTILDEGKLLYGV